jgi:UDP-N-acetyl-2-amino-2-deoxyglucuronate dehydrogenase
MSGTSAMTGVAILGTGAIAKVHTEAYKQFGSRCAIRSLCDIYPEKAQALASDKGLDSASCYADYRQAIDRPEVDLVSICLPPSAHAETAIFALDAGKHVLLEKPMAPSLEECDAILAAAARSGARLSVVSQNRFQTTMFRLKHVLDSGLAGRLLHAAVNSYLWRGQNYYDLWWRGTWEKEGGGCTLNHAVHHVDLLLWMMGMPQSVFAHFANLNHDNSETEDFSTAVLSYKTGALAQLTASLVHHGEEQELIFQCGKARLSFPWKVWASTPLENGFPKKDVETERLIQEAHDSLQPLELEGHAGQIRNLLDAIQKDSLLLVDGAAGRNTLELIMGIYKSAQSKTETVFPIQKDDPFYRSSTMLPLLPRFHQKTRSTDNFGTSDISLGRRG